MALMRPHVLARGRSIRGPFGKAAQEGSESDEILKSLSSARENLKVCGSSRMVVSIEVALLVKSGILRKKTRLLVGS